ncbi:MAG: GxxExxY protein [Sedimentisphaerales bacterium]|nr:GxxExxY protein [Sedimentisphaerales bacterium]
MLKQSYLYSELTEVIIGAAIEVHKMLGVGFLESVYEEALAIEFELRNINYERQKQIDVLYKGRLAKQFICDFIIDGKVIIELKAVKKNTEIEYSQVINYLKATGLEVGLLLNFGAKSLEIKRFINSNQ